MTFEKWFSSRLSEDEIKQCYKGEEKTMKEKEMPLYWKTKNTSRYLMCFSTFTSSPLDTFISFLSLFRLCSLQRTISIEVVYKIQI